MNGTVYILAPPTSEVWIYPSQVHPVAPPPGPGGGGGSTVGRPRVHATSDYLSDADEARGKRRRVNDDDEIAVLIAARVL